jgi:hypothetical protein
VVLDVFLSRSDLRFTSLFFSRSVSEFRFSPGRVVDLELFGGIGGGLDDVGVLLIEVGGFDCCVLETTALEVFDSACEEISRLGRLTTEKSDTLLEPFDDAGECDAELFVVSLVLFFSFEGFKFFVSE